MLQEATLLQVAYLEPGARQDVEQEAILPHYDLLQGYPVPAVDDYREVPGLEVKPPDVVRYFVRAKPEALARFAAEHDLEGLDPRRVEDEYVYDMALRVYVLLRLHGANVEMTLLSPNHLIRRSNPPTSTFVNEKNEVYNNYQFNKDNRWKDWPNGGSNGNLRNRVQIAKEFFKNTPKNRRIFLSFHADIDPNSPEAPLVLYYRSTSGRNVDTASKKFASSLLPSLGAGAYTRGQYLGVLKNNPAGLKLLLEMRNLAYTDHAWALRFEQLRQRDAEKVVKALLDYVG
jgi:N-acetylmuramoyl-L-alanine amidase